MIEKIPIHLDTSKNNIQKELYTPLLKWADRYDRGVGYFTSGWIEKNLLGVSDFLSRGGKIRWIVSPIIDDKDKDFFLKVNSKKYEKVDEKILKNYELILKELSYNTINTLATLIEKNQIEIKFAIPKEKLDGDFHDKFGIFYKDIDANNIQVVSFNGSMNETKKGFSNYESFKVFKSIDGLRNFIDPDIIKFKRLWNSDDDNVAIYDMPKAIKNRIFKVRKKKKRLVNNKWRHQDEAVKAFLNEKNGIIEMATGTGKTRTAIKILTKLFNEDLVDKGIVTVYGTDLLNQWNDSLNELLPENILIYKDYAAFKQRSNFLLAKKKKILIVSRDANKLSDIYNKISIFDKTIFIADEVHGLGSKSFKEKLDNKINKFEYRLGLSATPVREYDSEGNDFISNEIGNIQKPVFEFGIKDAIERGILCEMNYTKLEYFLTDEENKKIQTYISMYNSDEYDFSEEWLYMQISKVRKNASVKIESFLDYLESDASILKKTIIFVETKEYGRKLQNRLINYNPIYNTYYGGDSSTILQEFSLENVDYLITSKKISEGIDIKSVENIVLFTSDRSRLTTVQRIGRSLRINPKNKYKVASIIDFIDSEHETDINRSEWLEELSKVRFENE